VARPEKFGRRSCLLLERPESNECLAQLILGQAGHIPALVGSELIEDDAQSSIFAPNTVHDDNAARPKRHDLAVIRRLSLIPPHRTAA
jgi:hypothetical protein